MRESLPIDAKGQGPTPKGQGPTALNAYRHGLTAQLNILTTEEQQAYDQHSKITLEALAPATDYERDLAQSIADDRRRLKRARTIESGMFAIGMQHGADSTGSPHVDDALAQARTWMQEARNLQLLTIYEQRIRRALDKAIQQLESIQTKALVSTSPSRCKPYRPEAYFTTAPPVRESVFSTAEIARELSRDKLIRNAMDYGRPGILRRKQVAQASAHR